MTRDQAIKAVATVNYHPMVRYWTEEIEIAAKFIDSLIAIGVFVPECEAPQIKMSMSKDGGQIFGVVAK